MSPGAGPLVSKPATSKEIVRSFAQESVVSRPMHVQRNVVMGLSALIFVFMLGLDLIDRKHNIFYLNSMLAFVVCGALIASMLRFTHGFADEVRCGPDYLVARRGSVTALVPIDQVEHVRLRYFVNSLFITHFLARIEVNLVRPCALGTTIAFHPQDDWRAKWTRGPMQNLLGSADTDSII